MKLPVSREKYEQSVQERTEALAQVAQLVSENEKLTAQIQALENPEAEQHAHDLQLENERLSAELEQATQTAQSHAEQLSQAADLHVEQTANLNSQLDDANTRISDLEQTVERLNQEGAIPPAKATSQGDNHRDSSTSLNDFMSQNQDDTMACIQRLKKEGF